MNRCIKIFVWMTAGITSVGVGSAWGQTGSQGAADHRQDAGATHDRQNAGATVTGRRITLEAANGEIGDILRMVASQGGLNLVIGPDVKGEVSVYLDDVDVHTALRSIAVNNGFIYTVEDSVIAVSVPPQQIGEPEPPPLVTRVFQLRCQDAERVRDALEFALSKYGKMKVLNENSDSTYGVQSLSSLAGNIAGAGGVGGGAAAYGGGGVGQQQGQQSGIGGRLAGPMQLDAQSAPRNARKLIVTDVRERVEQIAELIADLDKLPPQVLIEARIVEMTTDLQRQLGIDWNISAFANGPIIDHQWPLRNRAGFASGPSIIHNTSGTPVTNSGMALGTIDFSQLTAMVRANQQDSSIRLLANPRLLVYNNHSASILVGERYPILQATITDFGTVTEAFSEFIPVGVQLEVTPTIMLDGRISMLVHPATSALGDDVIGTTGLRVARIRTRELDTRVIMHDGQTIVLGGLISDRKTHQVNKVPGLGDLPVLSAFFRQENPQSERVDLLVFLTAHVESATEISDRDQCVYEMYKPHFKHVERLQDVPLHFEVPTEYEPPRPMFSDPPIEEFYEEEQIVEPGSPMPPPQPTTNPNVSPRPMRAAQGETTPEAKGSASISQRVEMNDATAADDAGDGVFVMDAHAASAIVKDSFGASVSTVEETPPEDGLRRMRSRLMEYLQATAKRHRQDRTESHAQVGAERQRQEVGVARSSRTLANQGVRIDDEP